MHTKTKYLLALPIALGFGLASALLAAVTWPEREPAPSPAEPRLLDRASLEASCRDADLVFEGTVLELQYRSEPIEHSPGATLPHTYVTFALDQIHKGTVTGDLPGRLTLRFLGGLEADGARLEVSHGVHFEVGSSELLFVRNHGSWGVPLLSEGPRRLLLRDGRVVSEHGAALVDETGQFLDRQGLRTLLSSATADSPADAVPAVASADPEARFLVPALDTTPPPPVQREPRTYPVDLRPEDRLELQLFERNGGNPVLR